jgi:hypothetical protein
MTAVPTSTVVLRQLPAIPATTVPATTVATVSSNSTIVLLPLQPQLSPVRPPQQTPTIVFLCFNCGKSVTSPATAANPSKSNSPRAPAPSVNQQRGLAPWSGHANYTTTDETPTGEELVAGTFFINKYLSRPKISNFGILQKFTKF